MVSATGKFSAKQFGENIMLGRYKTSASFSYAKLEPWKLKSMTATKVILELAGINKVSDEQSRRSSFLGWSTE